MAWAPKPDPPNPEQVVAGHGQGCSTKAPSVLLPRTPLSHLLRPRSSLRVGLATSKASLQPQTREAKGARGGPRELDSSRHVATAAARPLI